MDKDTYPLWGRTLETNLIASKRKLFPIKTYFFDGTAFRSVSRGGESTVLLSRLLSNCCLTVSEKMILDLQLMMLCDKNLTDKQKIAIS